MGRANLEVGHSRPCGSLRPVTILHRNANQRAKYKKQAELRTYRYRQDGVRCSQFIRYDFSTDDVENLQR